MASKLNWSEIPCFRVEIINIFDVEELEVKYPKNIKIN